MEYSRLKNNRPLVGLSPMAGYTDSAFRGICRKLGADFVVTELVSADGIIQSWKAGNQLSKTFELMHFEEGERPLFVQLFGGEPSKLEEASRIVAGELKPDGIDINMGCPAHKVVCNGYGCALLKDPQLAARVAKAAITGSGLSVSVKTRVGWSDDSLIDDFAKAIADAGIDMLALHGRTYEQGFSGEADWEPIYRVKNALSIPVFGNGDIRSGADALAKVQNLDGILIGRASVGNPWIFAEVQRAFSLSSQSRLAGRGIYDQKDSTLRWNDREEISWETKFELLRSHATLKFEQKGERGLVEMRKFIPAYVRGLPNSSEMRAATNTITTLDDIERVIDQIRCIILELHFQPVSLRPIEAL